MKMLIDDLSENAKQVAITTSFTSTHRLNGHKDIAERCGERELMI